MIAHHIYISHSIRLIYPHPNMQFTKFITYSSRVFRDIQINLFANGNAETSHGLIQQIHVCILYSTRFISVAAETGHSEDISLPSDINRSSCVQQFTTGGLSLDLMRSRKITHIHTSRSVYIIKGDRSARL